MIAFLAFEIVIFIGFFYMIDGVGNIWDSLGDWLRECWLGFLWALSGK